VELQVKYREVGNTGVKISEIGFGGGGNAGLMVNGTPEEQRDAISRALDLGINYFDNSGHYGDGASELNLGARIKELGVRPYITTKVEVRSHNRSDIAAHVMTSLDESLERLGVDYVDFIQIHNGPVLEDPHLEGANYNTLWIEDYLKERGAVEGLQAAQKAGKTRFTGFCCRGNDFTPCKQLIDTGAFDLMNVSVHLLNPLPAYRPFGMRAHPDAAGILGYAAAHGVGAAVYSPLAGGALTDNSVRGGPPHPITLGPTVHTVQVGDQEITEEHPRGPRNNNADKARRLAFLSQGGQHNLAQAAMRYVLSLDGVTTALGGFSDVHQVEEGVSASGAGPLSEENMARIEMVWRANFGLDEDPEPRRR
jgi:aryl-alcohol dehydrogenase-like predicted oxidoreductase